MSNERKFYWLKLKDDFFTSKRIKKLRKIAGGDTYVIIYLKMQLLAMKSDGVLKWTGLEDDFASELALDLDEDPSNVEITLRYLLSCGLAETENNTDFFFPYAVTNTGSETSAAERMRKMRERNNVTPALLERYTDIDIDTDKELDTDTKKKVGVFQSFAQGDKDLLKALREFNDFRNAKKKPMTDGAKQRICARLQKEFPREQWIPILQQSIDKGWTDIYPLNGTVETKTDKYTGSASFRNAVTDLMNG